MKFVALFALALAAATPARAQHVHDQGPPPAPQRGGGPQTPPIDVPWNDAIPAGTVEHAARALRPAGTLLIVDFTLESDQGPPKEHRMSPEQVVKELEEGGLRAEVVRGETLPTQYLVRGSLLKGSSR